MAGEFENAAEGGSFSAIAPPTAFRAALLLQTVLPTAIPSGAPLLRPWLEHVVFSSQGSTERA